MKRVVFTGQALDKDGNAIMRANLVEAAELFERARLVSEGVLVAQGEGLVVPG